MNSAETSLKIQVRLAARAVRHSPDRALHPLRRWAQQRRLQPARLPRAVLFVCHGNICRSPYAAHAFQRMLPPVLQESILIGSAGFFGPDRASPAAALQAAALRGVDLGDHRAVLVNVEVVRAMDLIVVMEAVQRDQITLWHGADPRRVVVLGDLDPRPIDTRTIRDPILQPVEVFSATYERIDRCVAELYRLITGEEPMPLETPHPARGIASRREAVAPLTLPAPSAAAASAAR
jgi:protein-tyrosine-phosphatase